MTFVGKILVIVIMLFSVVFLGISTVAFTTSKNWVTAAAAEKQKVEDLKKKLNDAQAEAGAANKVLEDAKSSFAALAKGLESKISLLEEQNKHDQVEYTTASGQLATANQNAKSSLDEVEAMRKTTLGLRQQKSAVERQANQFKSHKAELTDRIHELERQLETATKNHTGLLTQNGRMGP